jgi:hypothetical protein
VNFAKAECLEAGSAVIRRSHCVVFHGEMGEIGKPKPLHQRKLRRPSASHAFNCNYRAAPYWSFELRHGYGGNIGGPIVPASCPFLWSITFGSEPRRRSARIDVTGPRSHCRV